MDPNPRRSEQTDICSTCGQLVAPQRNRCPRCGSPMKLRGRRLPLLIGIAGVLALLFVVVLMVVVVQNSESGDEAPTTTESPR